MRSIATNKPLFVFHNHNTTFKKQILCSRNPVFVGKNLDLLYRKFGKGRYRPKDLDQLWDIEEAITYPSPPYHLSIDVDSEKVSI